MSSPSPTIMHDLCKQKTAKWQTTVKRQHSKRIPCYCIKQEGDRLENRERKGVAKTRRRGLFSLYIDQQKLLSSSGRKVNAPLLLTRDKGNPQSKQFASRSLYIHSERGNEPHYYFSYKSLLPIDPAIAKRKARAFRTLLIR